MPESQHIRGESSSQCLTNDPQSHALFLSHSGKQKPFAKDLYDTLHQNGFGTFFDIKHHSLPPGEPFPPHIFQAAQSCEVALVVLSEDFVCSKWPMIELCAFVDAMAPRGRVKLIPLFYELSCDDLKGKKNRQTWRNTWTDIAINIEEEGGKHPINVAEWEEAFELLTSLSGVVFDRESEAEKGYIEKIVTAVHAVVAPDCIFDTRNVAGKDRLCQVIEEKFKEMEQEYAFASTSNLKEGELVTCVLGLYGLPGSGKSTLCRCLVDHNRHSFGSTKVFYVSELDNVSGSKSVLARLERCRSSRVFLVVDNISTYQTQQALESIVKMGFGHGSKIILVAHTLEVLSETLACSCEHWACDIMAVPTIDENEALEILERTARWGLDKEDPRMKHLSIINTSGRMETGRMEILKRIVRMCGHEGVWSPLVMETMGAQLHWYGVKWESVSDKDFWQRVEVCKQKALIETLLKDNFEALSKDHQLIFLDVVLFTLHFEREFEAVISLLSIMHRIKTPKLRMMIIDLQRGCFLTVSTIKYGLYGSSTASFISVQDVYLQFAKGIEECGVSNYMKPTEMINWCWPDRPNLPLEGDEILQDGRKARALVLQVQGQSCETVDLQAFSELRAVCLMGFEHVVLLGLAGLSFLRILEIRDCASFRQGGCNDENGHFTSVRSLQRFVVEVPRYYSQVIGKKRGREVEEVSREVEEVPRTLVSLMRNLQVLRMENTGIDGLDCNGSMWPQLRELSVVEGHLKRFKMGCLPQLQRFYFDEIDSHLYWRLLDRSSNDEYLLPEKVLRRGCPKLKLVKMEIAFNVMQAQVSGFLPAGLDKWELRCPNIRAIQLPDLNYIPSTALQELSIACCDRLEKVKFDWGFQTLQTLRIVDCSTLVEVEGLGSLPKLRVFIAIGCRNLQSLKGLAGLKMLEELSLVDLDELSEISCYISNLMMLHTLRIEGCGSLGGPEEFLSMPQSDEILGQQLRKCTLHLHGSRCSFSLLNLAYLEYFRLTTYVDRANGNDYFRLDHLEALKTEMILELEVHGFGHPTVIHNAIPECAGSCSSMISHSRAHNGDNDDNDPRRFLAFNPSRLKFNGDQLGSALKDYDGDDDVDHEPDVDYHPVMVSFRIRPGGSLQRLELADCDGVNNMADIEFMHLGAMLEECCFKRLHNLRNLRGLEFLVQLRKLTVSMCPNLEEMPSLHALVRMQLLSITWCPKLKAVDGCDSMAQLRLACFDGCEIMERLPFRDFTALSNLEEFKIKFDKCSKLRGNVEEMVRWVVEKVAPPSLRWESLQAMLELYCRLHVGSTSASDINTKEQMAEAFLSFWERSSGDCLDLSWIDSPSIFVKIPWSGVDKQLLRTAVLQLQQMLIRYQGGFDDPHVSSVIRFLDDPLVAKYKPFRYFFKGFSYIPL